MDERQDLVKAILKSRQEGLDGKKDGAKIEAQKREGELFGEFVIEPVRKRGGEHLNDKSA